MEKNNLKEITGSTVIFIMPGYVFKVCDGLVTNFHQPGSTLILLIAAFTKNYWKKIYEDALDNDYRFLSYGDSSLLWWQKD
jgi:S-adenosylmethionine:tRNA ribosyltransferase-isomerase